MFIYPKKLTLDSERVRQLMDTSGWDARQTQLFFGWVCLCIGPAATQRLCDALGVPHKVFKAGRNILDPPLPKDSYEPFEAFGPGVFERIRQLLDKHTTNNPVRLFTRFSKESREDFLLDLDVLNDFDLVPRSRQSLLHALGYDILSSSRDAKDRLSYPLDYYDDLNGALSINLRRGHPVLFVECRHRAKYDPRFVQDPALLNQGILADLDVLTDTLARQPFHSIKTMSSQASFVHLEAVDQDRSAFAAACLTTWWHTVGQQALQDPERIFALCDNADVGNRLDVWKEAFSELAKETPCPIEVWHIPSCTFRVHRWVHRLFFYSVEQNKAGKKWINVEAVVHLLCLPRALQDEPPASFCQEGPIVRQPRDESQGNRPVQYSYKHYTDWGFQVCVDDAPEQGNQA